MKAPRFEKWFAALTLLNRPQRKRGGRAWRRGISRELDCILVARDRSGQTIDAVTGRGAVTVAQLTQHLLPKLDPQALLVSDANAAYRAFASKHRIAYQGVNLRAGQRVRLSAAGVIHVQKVNAYHQPLSPVAYAISRRGISLSAELSGLALGARHGSNCYRRTIVQHRSQTHLYETVTAPIHTSPASPRYHRPPSGAQRRAR